ncbi:probable RNA helicase armi [Anabrus simplex]|uniref:probable RNA helicase armi n=1 Tax=Anabrus simplex TaxID=316456 RepID=UPI0035A2BE29
MSALLKILSGALWSPKKDEVKPDLDSLYAAIVESEISADDNDPDEPSAVIDVDTFEGDACNYRSGTVTTLSSDHGLIDNHLFFDLKNVTLSLQVGDRVFFLAYKRRATEEWRVKKIISIQDEEWDGDENKDEDADLRDAKPRTIVGRVTERDGRNVIVNQNITFSLDDVKADFTPIEGDWVKLEALVEVDENVTDLSGEILVVDRVCPLRWRVFTGNVTHWMKTAGAIDENVFFTRDSCEPGYYPRASDGVAVQAIESTQGQFSWRALTVVPMFQRVGGSVVAETSAEVQMLLKNKNGITITEKLDFGKLNVGESKEIIAEIKNISQMKQVLKYSKFHSSRRESQMSLLDPPQDGYIPIYPYRSVMFRFSCKGLYLGQSSELFVFTFKGFKIGRYLEVDVQDPTLTSVISPQEDNVCAWKRNSSDIAHKMKQLSNSKGIVVSGVRPVKPPAFVRVRLGMFPVPERLWKAVLGSENMDDAIDKVQSMMPCLKKELSFLTYTDRFHTLLYLEEINQNILMRHYDIERAKFSFAGESMEFLALEIPGLAEKRPSLIIGDKVIATPLDGDPNKPEVKYEGFIHKVRCSDVLLKFNATFHASYADEEYSISFYPTRTPMRMCHASVDLAKKNLGERVLFPNGIQLQEPQLLLAEEYSPPDANNSSVENGHGISPVMMNSRLKYSVRLKWFNHSLNQKQKEAVCNVLRGEARPLPYVIFGPPGTGKTITLVETILQIMFNIPESRLLVATPSNSSANLIAERLLDSGVLRPGDLVRLVGYHCLEEGTVPARLIPYSTTGDIRLNHQEHIDYGKLKPASNASTLGRHRVTVGTCISLGQLITMGFPRGHFTHVLVDEAGQATEPELLVPLSFLHTSSGQIVLAGDPLQLGPVVGSQVAKHFGLDESFLLRILGHFPYQRDPQGFSEETGGFNPRLVTRLVMNYRSLPEILHLSSSLFYNDQLEPQVCDKDSKEAELLVKLAPLLPNRDCGRPPAIVFHGIRGTNYQDKDCPSWFNPQEMVQVLYYVRLLFNEGLSPDDVGIITPYQKQVQKIRGLLEQLEIPIPKIGSVEEFQGQERLVIILSAVRSSSVLVPSDIRHALGFVASPQRLNVAITRARALLLVLGNPHLLTLDPYWRNVIDYCVKRDAYIGSDLPSANNCELLTSLLSDENTCNVPS